MKFIEYKKKFIRVLTYINTPPCKAVIDSINSLPDEAENEFHALWLMAQLVSKTLEKITINHFKEFEEEAKLEFASLFVSETPSSPKALFRELKLLKKVCDEFFSFYLDHTASIKKALFLFTDPFVIEDFEESPSSKNTEFQNAVFLDDQDLKEEIIQAPKSVAILGMRPCLGLVIAGLNQQNQLACTAWHISSAQFVGDREDHYFLWEEIMLLIDHLKTAGFYQNLRLFLTGADMDSFPLVLDLVTDFLKQPDLNMGMNLYMLPSLQGGESHCCVQLLQNSLSIRVGVENDYKYILVQDEKEISLSNSEDSVENEVDINLHKEDENSQNNTDFFKQKHNMKRKREDDNDDVEHLIKRQIPNNY